MELNELTYKIIGCAYDVHKALGPGLLESTYEKCLCFELEKLGIKYEKQKELPINYKGMTIDNGYRIDIMVEDKIVIELKKLQLLELQRRLRRWLIFPNFAIFC